MSLAFDIKTYLNVPSGLKLSGSFNVRKKVFKTRLLIERLATPFHPKFKKLGIMISNMLLLTFNQIL